MATAGSASPQAVRGGSSNARTSHRIGMVPAWARGCAASIRRPPLGSAIGLAGACWFMQLSDGAELRFLGPDPHPREPRDPASQSGRHGGRCPAGPLRPCREFRSLRRDAGGRGPGLPGRSRSLPEAVSPLPSSRSALRSLSGNRTQRRPRPAPDPWPSSAPFQARARSAEAAAAPGDPPPGPASSPPTTASPTRNPTAKESRQASRVCTPP